MNFDIRYVSNLNNSMLFKINTNFYGNGTSITENNLIKWKKNALYLRVNAFSTNKNYCTNWGLYFFTSPTGHRTAFLRAHPCHAKV